MMIVRLSGHPLVQDSLNTYDETTSVRDTTLPLGEFLDEQLARVRENEIIENEIIEDSDDEGSPPM